MSIANPLKAKNAARRFITPPGLGRIALYADESAEGRPLVLVHSINAAPSVHEMRPLFDHYAGSRPVYALDLPGFGASDRSDRPYTVDLFVSAVAELLSEAVAPPAQGADVIALSLGSEFAARAALNRPDQVRSLTLISPTGMSRRPIQPPGDAAYRVVSFPLLAKPLFGALVTRPSIRFFLGKQFVEEPPAEFMELAYQTANQPGARHAPLYFLSGKLFSPDILPAVYARLDIPALVLYDRDPNVNFDRLAQLLDGQKNWQARRIAPSLGLPHWELLPAVTAALDQFWAALEGA